MDNKAKSLVKLYMVRHGQKDPNGGTYADLTDHGRNQVTEAFQNHLAEAGIEMCFSSLIGRAAETSRIGSTLVGNGTEVIQHSDFGFDGLYLDEYGPAMEKAKAKEESGQIVTLADFAEWMPIYFPAARERLSAGINFAAKLVAANTVSGVGLIGSHSPYSEVLVANPHEASNLGEAGIVRYLVCINDDGTTEVVGSEIIFEGY